MKALNPWTVTFSRYMSLQVFSVLNEAITKSSTSYGIVHQHTSREIIISFTEMKRVLRDLEQFCRMAYFVKNCKRRRRGKVSVLVRPDKILEIRYRKRQSDVVVTCHYSFENEFGYVFC